jgi:hypothetical protein
LEGEGSVVLGTVTEGGAARQCLMHGEGLEVDTTSFLPLIIPLRQHAVSGIMCPINILN